MGWLEVLEDLSCDCIKLPSVPQSVMEILLVLFLQSLLLVSAEKTTIDFLRELKLSYETHTVETEDGYLLEVYRIPNKGGTPVLMVHGFLATSSVFLIMERENNLATILADKGYDIWLTNQRGNVFSHRHVSLSSDPSNYKYWNFSVDEIAARDLPATIDYILSNTNREKLLYVGHSMGTTLFFIMCSLRPDYCAKVSLAVLLAPIAYPSQQIKDNRIRTTVALAPAVSELLPAIGYYEVLGRKQGYTKYIYSTCPNKGFLCEGIIGPIGFSPSNPLLKRPPQDYFDAAIGGTSVKTYKHMSTIQAPNGRFASLPSGNRRQNNNSSGEYAVDVSAPVALFWSTDDLYIDESSISKIIGKLKNIVFMQVINEPFTHTGYFFDLEKNYSIVMNILRLFGMYG